MRHPQAFSIPSYEFRMLLEAQRRRLSVADGEAHASRTHEAIDHALGRIREGRYGICNRCAREIDRARLKADPTTEYCSECHGQA